MSGTRHQMRLRGGFRLGLLSVFALLAFACFPAVAAADSSELEYRDAPPEKINPENTDKKRVTSPGGGDGSGQSARRPGSDDEPGARDKGGAGPVGGDKGGGQGGDGARAGKKNVDGGQQGNQLDVAPASSEDDDSSPLVPILIALAVLAAISIGAVAMRRRRREGDPGAPASPEAS